jgi:hypothetical protein
MVRNCCYGVKTQHQREAEKEDAVGAHGDGVLQSRGLMMVNECHRSIMIKCFSKVAGPRIQVCEVQIRTW